MPLLRHLEASIVFSVLSQILHSWILTYITSPNLEFDVEQGGSWLMACLINKEGLRAFPPQTWADVTLFCVYYSCQRLLLRNLVPEKTGRQSTPATEPVLLLESDKKWRDHYHYQYHNQYSVQNFFSLLDSWIIKKTPKQPRQSLAVEQFCISQTKCSPHTIYFY